MKHLDEGLIQAFLDGELSGANLEQTARHLADCEICSAALSDAESELETFNFAFAAENSSVVPTQRIWARIENEIETLDTVPQPIVTRISAWQKLAQFFTFPRLAVAGSCAVFLLGAIVAFNFFDKNPPNLAVSNANVIDNSSKTIETASPTPFVPPSNLLEVATATPNVKVAMNPKPQLIEQKAEKPEFKFENANYSKAEAKNKGQNANNKEHQIKDENPQPASRNPKSNEPLTEEKGLLDTIARLQKTAKDNEDELAMRPSLRVEYEKNLAVMDSAINQLQQQARKNPKDENAKQSLIATYRSKIDLLGAVAEKSQLVASLR